MEENANGSDGVSSGALPAGRRREVDPFYELPAEQRGYAGYPGRGPETYSPSSGMQGVDLFRMVKLLKRHALLILGCTTLGIAGSVLWLLIEEPEWEATARLTTEGASVEGFPAELDGRLVMTRDGLTIDSLVVSGTNGDADVRGFVPLIVGRDWDLQAEIRELSLAPLLERRELELLASLGGALRVVGPLDDQPSADDLL